MRVTVGGFGADEVLVHVLRVMPWVPLALLAGSAAHHLCLALVLGCEFQVRKRVAVGGSDLVFKRNLLLVALTGGVGPVQRHLQDLAVLGFILVVQFVDRRHRAIHHVMLLHAIGFELIKGTVER